MTTVIEAIIYNKPAIMGLVSPFSNIYMIIGNNSCCVEITFEEDHLGRRGGSPNKEIELLLLLNLNVLNMGHTLVHILL